MDHLIEKTKERSTAFQGCLLRLDVDTITLPDGMQPGILGSALVTQRYAASLSWGSENQIITLDADQQLTLFTLE